jgi:Fis family transcriptional regulator
MAVDKFDAETNDTTTAAASSRPDGSLRDSVTRAVRAYLEELDGQLGSDVYQMVLSEVEGPLLREIMHYTRNNQSKASRMLGLNRGTLRKKLKIHGLLPDSGE